MYQLQLPCAACEEVCARNSAYSAAICVPAKQVVLCKQSELTVSVDIIYCMR